MDIDGRNVKKLVFDLTNFNNFDEKSLYYFKKESLRFKVIVPVGNGKTEEHYERHHVTRYFRFDKETGISEVVLTLGLPSAKKNSYKAGCFGKTVEGDVIYEEVPEVREFRRKGLHAVGEVEAEAEAEKKTNATLFSGNNPASNSGCSSSNNNSGCSSSNNNSGCSSSNNNSGCASTTKR